MLGEIKLYIRDQIELTKLETVETVSIAMSKLIVKAILAIFGLFFMLSISIAAGFLIGEEWGNGYGFLAVAGFYFLLMFLLLLFQGPIKRYIMDRGVSAALGNSK